MVIGNHCTSDGYHILFDKKEKRAPSPSTNMSTKDIELEVEALTDNEFPSDDDCEHEEGEIIEETSPKRNMNIELKAETIINPTDCEHEEGEIVEPPKNKAVENISGISYICLARYPNSEYDIYIGPPTRYHNTTKWSNPFPKFDPVEYEQYLRNRTDFHSKILSLENKTLACRSVFSLLLK